MLTLQELLQSAQIPSILTLEIVRWAYGNKKVGDFKMRKAKPPLVNQQRLVYKFECDLCKVGCVHYTSCHLHQRIEEHKNASSSISQHFCDKHSSEPKDLSYNFSNLKKCKSKFDCLLFEMFFIK